MKLSEDVKRSIGCAVAFLVGARDSRGWWRDFDTLAGPSDEWVTAYVAHALSFAEDARAMAAAEQAWKLLKRRQLLAPGWSYNGFVPRDADSTLWALALAARVGAANSLPANRARAFARTHLRDDGSIATYRDGKAIRLFTRLGRDVSFAGWCAGHTCVSALAASVLEPADTRRIAAYLRSSQRDDGTWRSYWWCHEEYATALATVALERIADPADSERLQRAAEGVIGLCAKPFFSVHDEPYSPFRNALQARVVMRAPNDARMRAFVREIANALTKSQRADGSWEPSAALRIPPPGVGDPDSYHGWTRGTRGGGSIQTDQHAFFTTATVLTALTEIDGRALGVL